MKKINSKVINDFLDNYFIDARCELIHKNDFEMLIAVMLSAQTTDVKVNSVTPTLFSKYDCINKLANANLNDVENIIKPLGLYKNKAKNIISCANEILTRFNGKIPSSLEELTSLSGVGRKTASVVLIECFDKVAFPVDTHINRVLKRIGVASENDSVLEVENKFRKLVDENRLKRAHHQLIFMGRYMCHAIKPECDKCPLTSYCSYFKK